MSEPKLILTEEGKEAVAIALILLKDFKTQGKFDVEATLQILTLAKIVGVSEQYEKMMVKLPPMKITPRYE